jgi:hypothetical protein
MSADGERIAELERQIAALTAARSTTAGVPDAVPLKLAMEDLACSEQAALKRAQRAAKRQPPQAWLYDGRWYLARRYIAEVAAAKRMDEYGRVRTRPVHSADAVGDDAPHEQDH